MYSIVLALAFFASALASKTCQVQTGTSPPTFSPNLDSPSAEDIRNAVTAWINDVCTVDSFLNNPISGPTPLNTAIAYAADEPNQLRTLAALPNLSQAGQEVAANVSIGLDSVNSNLDNIENGSISTDQAITNISFSLCCAILPSISKLVHEAAVASGAFGNSGTPSVTYPNPCAVIKCSRDN